MIISHIANTICKAILIVLKIHLHFLVTYANSMYNIYGQKCSFKYKVMLMLRLNSRIYWYNIYFHWDHVIQMYIYKITRYVKSHLKTFCLNDDVTILEVSNKTPYLSCLSRWVMWDNSVNVWSLEIHEFLVYTIFLVRLWNKQLFAYVNHARIRSWNQPVPTNESKVSCSRKQRGPLMGLCQFRQHGWPSFPGTHLLFPVPSMWSDLQSHGAAESQLVLVPKGRWSPCTTWGVGWQLSP